MSDLEHVAAVLEGRAPSAPIAARGGKQRGSTGGRGESDRQGRARPYQARPSRARSGSRQRQPDRASASLRGRTGEQRQATEPSSSGPNEGEAAGSATLPEASVGPHSEPSPQSTHRVWHCAACDVWVPRRAGDWETHVRGIRHQRQLLSLKVHGKRGKLVLSAFESMPGPFDPAYRLVGKGAAQFGLVAGAPSRAQPGTHGPARAPENLATARRLRTQALAQLLHLFGVGQTYNAAAKEFSELLLSAALSSIGHSGVPATRETQGSGLQLRLAEGELRLRTAAALAAAAEQVQQQGYPCARAHLLVDLAGQHFGGVAAAFAGLRLLLNALASAPTLAHLAVSLKCSVIQAMPVYQLTQLERAWGSHVVQGLGVLLERHAALRTIVLEVPPSLEAPTRQHLPSLQDAAHTAPLATRQHLLLALHPRVGRCSVLQLLPLPLVGQILDLAAPLTPCAIEFHATALDGD